jgi:hypothetical protein
LQCRRAIDTAMSSETALEKSLDSMARRYRRVPPVPSFDSTAAQARLATQSAAKRKRAETSIQVSRGTEDVPVDAANALCDAVSAYLDQQASADSLSYALDWKTISTLLQQSHGLRWTPLYCQGLWKFMAYADTSAYVEPGGTAETLHNGSMHYDSDEEALQVKPTELTRAHCRRQEQWWAANGKKRKPSKVSSVACCSAASLGSRHLLSPL